VSITDITSGSNPAWKKDAVTSGSTSSGTVNPERYSSGFQGNTNSLVTLVDEVAVELLNADENQRLEIAKLLKEAGYNVPITGKYNTTLLNALNDAYYKAQEQSVRTNRPITTTDWLVQERDARKGFESREGKPSATISTRELTKDQTTGLIQDTYEKLLNRSATKKELSNLSKELTKALKNNPSKTTYVTRNGKTYQTTIPGLDPEDFLVDKIVATEEFKRRELTSPDLQQRIDQRREYEKLIKGLSPEEAMELRANTVYGRGLEETKARLEEYIIEIGGTATPEELDAVATQVYDRAIEGNPTLVRRLLRDTIKVSPDERLGGEAGKNLAELKRTAVANGLDLNQTFGSELQDWLRRINAGESIDTFKQDIRNVAKIGLPESVGKLVDRGVDLESIFSPYKRTMAAVLEINPETISLDDPTLRSAIGPDKEMSLYDFQRNLRQDRRWEYTDTARSEVSSLVNKVLKDFGFVG
jgi:hypothetical protein